MNRTYKPNEFSKRAGVTVRATHHCDRLGLLKPFSDAVDLFLQQAAEGLKKNLPQQEFHILRNRS